MTENIQVNTQSSIRISAEKIIYFDPLDIAGETHDADIIFITHSHYDHFSKDDIKKIAKNDTLYVVPKSMVKELTAIGIDKDSIRAMSAGEKLELMGTRAEAVPAYNLLKPFHMKINGWLGYIVTLSGKRIYVAGDTDATPEAKAVKCDIALLPIGGTYTMNAEEAAKLTNIIKPQTAIPTHYGSIVGRAEDGQIYEKYVDKHINIEFKLN